jgi:type II secretory pathway predicted ATPase ExeA
MFKSFYGMTINPFEKSLQENHAFKSKDHEQMLSRLDYLKSTRGIGLFTAPPGMGKTFTLRCFSQNLNPNLYELSYICLSTVSVTEFYQQFCHELKIPYGSKKSVMFRDIQERLIHLLKEKRKTFILAIDESQYLNHHILRDVKMLMNNKFDSIDSFTLILIGQPYLGSILEKPIHEALKQRIIIHYNYEGLTADESKDYIYSRIEIAGAARSIIDDAAVHAVANFCNGTPRIINSVMTNALILGSQLKITTIDTEVILSACNNLALS